MLYLLIKHIIPRVDFMIYMDLQILFKKPLPFSMKHETGSKPMKDWPTRELIKDYEQGTGKEIINPIPRAGAHIVNLKTQKIVADTRTIHNLNNQ